MNKCGVCGGEGWYPIIDNKGCERYSIKCPECFGNGEVDKDTLAEEIAADAERRAAAIQRGKYEAAMAESAPLLRARSDMAELDTLRELTELQRRGLAELGAACDELLRYFPHSEGWTRAWLISGTSAERSAKNLHTLVDLGLAEGIKPNGRKQTEWRWRITSAGRAALGPHP